MKKNTIYYYTKIHKWIRLVETINEDWSIVMVSWDNGNHWITEQMDTNATNRIIDNGTVRILLGAVFNEGARITPLDPRVARNLNYSTSFKKHVA